MTMPINITLFYTAILSFIYIYLARAVIKRRHACKASYGDGGDAHLRSCIRAHSNFAEYTPILIIFLLCGEINHVHPILLHIFGIMMIIVRVVHVYGLTVGEQRKIPNYKFRVCGTAGTFFLYITGSCYALIVTAIKLIM